mmetsp:Transcript_120069/g.350906  ORF Transcript_120069/g.350906 Transcript_120069/m.350906 type:complete len:80 (-) Transcript_120069:25-264(-)
MQEFKEELCYKQGPLQAPCAESDPQSLSAPSRFEDLVVGSVHPHIFLGPASTTDFEHRSAKPWKLFWKSPASLFAVAWK